MESLENVRKVHETQVAFRPQISYNNGTVQKQQYGGHMDNNEQNKFDEFRKNFDNNNNNKNEKEWNGKVTLLIYLLAYVNWGDIL